MLEPCRTTRLVGAAGSAGCICAPGAASAGGACLWSESPAAELGVGADHVALQERCTLRWLSPLGRWGWSDGWRGAEEEEHLLLSVSCHPLQLGQRKRAACWENYPAE